MRNLHLQIRQEYGIGNVRIFRRWEKLEYKMAAFQNHRIFTLRCLKEDLIPVSAKLRSSFKTPRAKNIIKKAERALLNERVRNINNTITMTTSERDTCMNVLSEVFSKEVMEECGKLISLRREAYYIKVKQRQIAKLERLCQKNKGGCPNIHHGGTGGHDLNVNNRARNPYISEDQQDQVVRDPEHPENQGSSIKDRWVVNLSSQPLSQAERSLLTHGPSFALTSRSPPIIDCVTTIEEVCQKLERGEAEELRGEVKAILKKAHPPKPNITREEQKAMEILRKDNTRTVLTADKGVALVVLDQEDYVKKAEELLSQTTYKKINNDPTNKHKNRLINLLKPSNQKGASLKLYTENYIQQGQGCLNFMASPKFIKKRHL